MKNLMFLIICICGLFACENTTCTITPANKGKKPIILQLDAKAPNGNTDFNISAAAFDLDKNLASSLAKCSDKIVFVGGAKNLEFNLKPSIISSQLIGIKTLAVNDLVPKNQGDFNFKI